MVWHKDPCSQVGSAGVLWLASYYFNTRGALGEKRKYRRHTLWSYEIKSSNQAMQPTAGRSDA
jgi:hypothetical protein